MQVLSCPECHEVMHRVREVTEQSKKAGIDQLARHCTSNHIVPGLERLLNASAVMVLHKNFDIEDLKAALAIRCPGCDLQLTEDSYFYVRGENRTTLCCSQECVDKVQQR